LDQVLIVFGRFNVVLKEAKIQMSCDNRKLSLHDDELLLAINLTAFEIVQRLPQIEYYASLR
jgi:hypothetical protein